MKKTTTQKAAELTTTQKAAELTTTQKAAELTTTQAQAKVNTTKARTAKSTKTSTNTWFKPKTTNNVDLTTIQLGSDISVAIETKTLDKMQSWAYHTYRDLEENYIYFDEAYEKGMYGIGYTEAELNQMTADAGLILSMSDPDDDERYCVTGANVFESCMGIISICKTIIDTMHSSVRPKSGKISVVKTMSEGLKYTDADDWDDF